jgi:hypothetical protein
MVDLKFSLLCFFHIHFHFIASSISISLSINLETTIVSKKMTLKQLANVKQYKHLGSLITEYAKRTRKIKSRNFVAKNDNQQEGHSLHQQIGIKFKEELI